VREAGRGWRLKTSLGTVDGKALPLDVDRLVVSRLLVQANSGGGKSWALRRLLEQTHGQLQHLVLDIEGEFGTLRERFDYVLAARTGGDCLAEPRSAGLLARRLLELGVSAIVDLYELQAAERVRFVRAFLEALLDAPRELWHPALVVVDEAHLFCPQNGSAESAGAVIDLMTRGRKRGFCGVLATQRLSKLHKDAAAEANCKLIGRASLDVDLRRAGDELGFSSREDLARVRSLPAGQFFAFGPGLSDQVQLLQVGPVETTHPRAGRGTAPVPPAREKVRKVLDQLKDLPQEAAQEAKTLAEAKARIAQLERELLAKPVAPAAKVERVELPVLKDGHLARIEAMMVKLSGAMREVSTAILKTQPAAPKGKYSDQTIAEVQRRQVAAGLPPFKPAIIERVQRGPTAAPPDGDPITGPEKRILDAIAWLEATNGRGNQDPAAVAFLAGYTIGGGAFNNPRGRLRSRGLIEYFGSSLALTNAGRALATFPAEALTADVLQQRVLERLPAPEAKLLRALLEVYPAPLSNEDLARRSGYEPGGGAFNNPRGRLRSLGLVDYPERGQVRACDVLFPGGGA
jgi:hypothetical protein